MGSDVVDGPQVERLGHRLAVVLPKEPLDVPVETQLLALGRRFHE